MSDVVDERLSPDEAFELVAHELRFHILRELNEADEPLAFTELQSRVGVDDPGQFNYHLGKLVGRFVRDGDEGYRLTGAGRRLVGAVFSGGYTSVLDADPVEMDVPCLNCGAPMSARFRDDGITIDCDDCDMIFTNPEIPPGVLETRSREEAPAVVDRWMKAYLHVQTYGFCPYCDGSVEASVVRPGDDLAADWFDGERFDVRVVHRCHRCHHRADSMVPFAILAHPAVVGFHHERGVDLRETPVWELDWFRSGIATLANDDPLRFEVPVRIGGVTRTFTFDADLDVVDERRVDAAERERR